MKRLWTMVVNFFRPGHLSKHHRDIVESQNIRTVTEAIGDHIEDEVRERIEYIRREADLVSRDHRRRFPPHGAGA